MGRPAGKDTDRLDWAWAWKDKLKNIKSSCQVLLTKIGELESERARADAGVPQDFDRADLDELDAAIAAIPALKTAIGIYLG